MPFGAPDAELDLRFENLDEPQQAEAEPITPIPSVNPVTPTAAHEGHTMPEAQIPEQQGIQPQVEDAFDTTDVYQDVDEDHAGMAGGGMDIDVVEEDVALKQIMTMWDQATCKEI